MKRPQTISVLIDSLNHAGFVGGHPRSQEYVEMCGGRPMWSRRRHMWATSEATAINVLALAERDGFAVRYERIGGDV